MGSLSRVSRDEAHESSLVEKAKFYTSLCLGTVAVVSVFVFLFLIPFVVDPAVSTIVADYDPEPVTCATTEHVYAEGLHNCSWASCREGCTSAAPRCHQILVNYSRRAFAAGADPPADWDVVNTRFFVNAEGCGYPPKVNCTVFAKQFGEVGKQPFPCYYSRTYPEMVVAQYSWEDNLRQLILSLLIPNLIFGVSVGVLCYWYCPGCGNGCGQSANKFPCKEDDHEHHETCYEEEDY
ncbi:protein tipE [Schistocerca cancellata]|uniref:protein tipE n=1 Tax=Schistocerca cancellata TaxID=274614 RepID=UPI0021180148|nr:protein tipE [Schistocerca cancellata]